MENIVLFKIKELDKKIVRTILKENSDINIPPLTSTQIQILKYMIEHQNEDVYQKDLENVLNLRRATVSGVLQTMEKNNLIKREIYENDVRVKKIILNEKTKSIFLKNKQKIDEIEKNIIKNISKKDLDKFTQIIDKLITNLNEYEKGKEKYVKIIKKFY